MNTDNDENEYDISCSITLQIFRDPVVAEDGFTYEREAIEKWLQNSDKSPNTGLPLSGKLLISNKYVKNHVETYINSNPIKKLNQYVTNIKTFDDIKYYNITDLSIINIDDLSKICKKMTVDELIYLLENVINITAKLQFDNMLLHIVCQNSSHDVIIYIIQHHINFDIGIEHENRMKFRPIHYICRNSSFETIKFMLDLCIENKYDFDCMSSSKIKPIHLICNRSTHEAVLYILNIYDTYNMDVQCRTNENKTPLSIIEQRFSRNSEAYKKICYIIHKQTPRRSCCSFFLPRVTYNEL